MFNDEYTLTYPKFLFSYSSTSPSTLFLFYNSNLPTIAILIKLMLSLSIYGYISCLRNRLLPPIKLVPNL